MATPTPLTDSSTSLIDSENINYELLLGEDDGGFLLVKAERGMFESVLHHQCFIGGQSRS